jgi:hypothetical protein
MKNYWILSLIIVIILSVTSDLRAEQKPVVYVLPHEIIGNKDFKNSDQHFFGEQEVQVPFILTFTHDADIKLQIKSTQLTASLGAPYDLKAEILPVSWTESIPTVSRILSLKLPDVQRETEFELEFQIDNDQDKNLQAVGKIAIWVYPRDIVAPLKAWSKKVQLRVYDQQGQLSDFLNKNEIDFVSYLAAKPLKVDRKVVTLWVSDSMLIADPPPMSPGESFIHIVGKSNGLPRVTVKQQEQQQFISVDFNFLDRVATDPVKQKMLVEIIQLVNE